MVSRILYLKDIFYDILSCPVNNCEKLSHEPRRSYYANGFATRAGICYDRSQDHYTARILT